MRKKCSDCNDFKPLDSFEKRKDSRDGRRHQCNKCRYDKYKWYKSLLRGMCNRSKNHTHITKDKDVNTSYMKELRRKQDGKCYWLDIDIDFTTGCKLRSPSVDRLDNDKGYIRGNIVLTTRFANLGRNSASDVDMEEFVREFLK